jgi:hypothetical protein
MIARVWLSDCDVATLRLSVANSLHPRMETL